MTRKLLPPAAKVLPLIVCAALLLSACSGLQKLNAAAQSAPASGSAASSTQGLSALQLAAGTLSLKDSRVPLEAAQAAALLPLWKAARTLANSDTAAEVEITALVAQIQAGLTAEQVTYIQSLSAEQLSSLAQKYGQAGPPGAPPDGAVPPSGAASAMGAPPAGMEGGPPPDGGGMPGGAPPSSSSSGSGTAETTNASFQGVSADLLEAVIQALQ